MNASLCSTRPMCRRIGLHTKKKECCSTTKSKRKIKKKNVGLKVKLLVLNQVDEAELLQFITSLKRVICFGCCSNSPPITDVDEPSKGLRVQGQTMKISILLDDFCEFFQNPFKEKR
ncbi:unnamed protein product [Lactuca virosa]|uniref:Uncharacterized protein n=1 Tax=Lactuca virosa TaxID=75947 RepID=A0AAU9MHD9_9ASTR|nr:unnamed protein product [Lactuca virosa]